MPAATLTSGAVALLLTLLEQRELFISGAAAEMHPDEVPLLVGAGLLVPDGHEDVAAVPGDDDDVPVSLFWSDTLGGLAGFSPTGGPVLVPPERLLRRRVDVAVALAAIAAELDLPARWQPTVQVEGLAWELGEVRLRNRPQRNSLWFARRLSERAVQRQVEAALAARPHPRLRVLLTSTRDTSLDELSLPGTSIVPVRDVLVAPDSLTVSGGILAARISGTTPSQHGGPIQLSEDGRTLVILDGDPIHFRSEPQIAVVRKLVAAHKSGKRFRARDLTEHGSLRRFFGEEKWALLAPHLSSVGGRWGFDV
ncbi:hypothetical protein [Roseomonas sp. BN140053]|uniref:hypothetical protein n=1 Tax=Roseomonas sp. BN140053 TaxID=3391898 RepID=UPI0039EA40B5